MQLLANRRPPSPSHRSPSRSQPLKPTSITLACTHPCRYQVTYWDDGIARWDAAEGPRVGAWQAKIPVEWFRRASVLVATLHSIGRALVLEPEVTIRVDGFDEQISYGASQGQEPESFWILATLLDGMAAKTLWAPLDTTGELDLSLWATSALMTLAKGSCSAQALARPEGLVVLAGSQPATSTAPALEDNYKSQRAGLAADGTFELRHDRFILVRHLFFSTPSAAASVMAGANTNGRRTWKDSSGRSWADLEFDS
jgi:Domain of unknown function (DUF4357)